jgi:anaerobic magnesium-protoporphyrin IX monomethyl ester cyclase
MNYLFIIPRGVSKAQCFNIFPVGIAYVSASLKQAGCNVFTINLEFYDGDISPVLERMIESNHIDVVCVGGLSYDCSKLLAVIRSVRAIKPGIITVVGGGIISSDPEPAMRVLGADIGIIGEGEITMRELASAMDKGLPSDDIPGLIKRNMHDDSYFITARRREIDDLDSLPLPDFGGFNYSDWTKISGTGLIVGSRSCTHNCTFCFHTSGRKYRQRSLDSIFNELEFQMDQFGIRCISMSDELFASDKQRVYEFCDRIREYHIAWSVALRVCDVDADLIRRMKESGCIGISYGLESADNRVLKSMRKMITVEQIKAALELTYEAGINTTGGFIFGDMREDRDTLKNTLDFWHQNNQRHYMSVTMINVFPGSYLYKHACKEGIIEDREKFLLDGCPLINVSKLTDPEYKDMTSLITELRLHPHVSARAFEIETIDKDGECSIDFTCRKCGAHTHNNAAFWFGKEIGCPSCGLINFVDPFQNAIHADDSFLAQLPDDGAVALWAAGGIYYKLIHKYPILASERFILVDGNASLHGLSICGKQVYPQDIISKKNIRTVVITALSFKREIHDDLVNRFPSVQHVLIPAFSITKTGIVPFLQLMDGEPRRRAYPHDLSEQFT